MRLQAVTILAIAMLASVLCAGTNTWTGTGNWSNSGNWSPSGPPGATDVAIIQSGEVTLSGPANVASLTVQNGAVMVFTNWSTKLTATTVSIEGTVTLPAPFDEGAMSNRIWFACTDLFVGDNGELNAAALGYAGLTDAEERTTGQGPGKGGIGESKGGGHGGLGGNSASDGGLTYGSATAPEAPGSSGGVFTGHDAGHGGGAIRIDATGAVVVNGTVTADGGPQRTSAAGAGSGGSVYISCDTFHGTGGVVRATGGDLSDTRRGFGGGGRIAVAYNPASQSNEPLPDVAITVGTAQPGMASNCGDMGTLHFPDTQFITTNLTYCGRLVIPGFTHWAVDRLTVSDAQVRFDADGFRLVVSNDLVVSGADALLDMGGNSNYLFRAREYFSDMAAPPALEVGGDVILTNGGGLYIGATATNGTNWGATVAVTGSLYVGSASHLYLRSHPTNGGSVYLQASNVTVTAGGVIDADGGGFGGHSSSAIDYGYGPGRGYRFGGGGYGGRGGYGADGGDTYGAPAAPLSPGSSGGTYLAAGIGGNGGGLVRIVASGRVTVDGTITVDGSTGSGPGGAGSGGGAYITCHTFHGAGHISAAGGNPSDTRRGRGGGGRITIVYDTDAQALAPIPTATFSADTYETRTLDSPYGDIGTIYFPDARLLGDHLSHVGRLTFPPAITAIAFDSLTVSGWVRFGTDGVAVTVTNDLVVDGSGAYVEMVGSPVYRADRANQYYSDSSATQTLHVGGNLVVTNGAWFHAAAARTNAGAEAYGALIDIDGALDIADSSAVYLRSHPTNGGSVLIRAGRVHVADTGTIDADKRGFQILAVGQTTGIGPGAPTADAGGAGYGGVGGGASGGATYGASNAPAMPGSGARSTVSAAGEGGGLVWIESDGTVCVEGTITADGGVGGHANQGAGAGGGIFIRCRNFEGNGELGADGGPAGTGVGEGGGGGRIAVWRAYDTYGGALSVGPNQGVAPTTAGTGTVVRFDTGPTIANLYATNETATTASLVGALTGTGIAPCEVTCYWGRDDGRDVTTNWYTNAYLGTSGIGPITHDIADLDLGTHYYFRFYATNAYGDNWGEPSGDLSTLGGLSVVNGAATDLTTTGATLQGNVTAGNPTPAAYFCWGTVDQGTSNTGLWEHVDYVTTALGPYSNRVTGLLANRTYSYVAYVTNASGGAWAPAVTNFTTPKPTLSILDPAPVPEADTELHFAVTLSATSHVDVTAVFATENGSATAPADYTATGGVLTIPAGEVSGTITVDINSDEDDEYPYHDFFVNLSAPNSTVFGKSQARGVILDDDDVNQTKVWTGTGDWYSYTNWSPAGRPGVADDVVIASGQVTLSNAMSMVSLTVSNGACVVLTNWETKVTATAIAVDGTVTLPAPFDEGEMSNRIWLVCSDLFVGSAGSLNADALGFAGLTAPPDIKAAGQGPGAAAASEACGGGYGGIGGGGSVAGGRTYGSAASPLDPGSSGGANITDSAGHGGGAIRIESSGRVTVNGTISADGGDQRSSAAGAGSGGSVYITCNTFHGTGGFVRARGGNPAADTRRGFGGGGRIAVAYDTAAQGVEPVPDVMFSAGTADIGFDANRGDLGTLHFPDTRFLGECLRHSGRFVIPGFTNWSVGSLALTNVCARFDADGFQLTVASDLRIDGSLARLELGGNEHQMDRPRRLYSQMTHAPQLRVGGDVALLNAGSLYVGSTEADVGNGASGARVYVGGLMDVTADAWVYVQSHPTNGATVYFDLGDLAVAADAGFDADTRGFACPNVVDNRLGLGPGAGTYRGGGGYGGVGNAGASGGIAGGTYGLAEAPLLPGSSGGEDNADGSVGGSGGGAIRLNVRGTLDLEGTLSADGAGVAIQPGGGSGGGIYVTCRTVQGTGTMRAVGGDGDGTYNGSGGGGRIAVWYSKDLTGGLVATNVAGGVGNYGGGAPGTVVWAKLRAGGTLFSIR